MDISNAVALITGGASGLGAATARRLHAAGAAVVLVDLPQSAGADLAAELGDRAVFVAADVTNEEQVQAAVDAAARLGPLRVLVNCAGVATPGKVLGRDGVLPLENFSRVIQINLIGTFNVLRLAAQAMAVARSLIRVMTIAPGIFETPMMAGLPQAAQDSLGAAVPHPSRLGKPAEYAALVEHIVANEMLNGETIRLDGAIRMQPK